MEEILEIWEILWLLGIQNVVTGPAAWASPEH